MLRVTAPEDQAYAHVARANRLLARLQRDRRDVSSMTYAGGRHAAEVFADTAPRSFPETRPHYE